MVFSGMQLEEKQETPMFEASRVGIKHWCFCGAINTL
tara:strand:+ start:26621 stop:26731 length:111 start_codon:yes stop_codon:yes gene_type:complete